MTQQIVNGAAVLRVARDADARGDVQRERFDLERLLQCGEHPLRPLHRLGLVVALEEHGELVASQPSEHRALAGRVEQPR